MLMRRPLYICSCFDGFEGRNCEIDLNDPCGCPNGVPKRPCLGDFGSAATIQCEGCLEGYELTISELTSPELTSPELTSLELTSLKSSEFGFCVKTQCFCENGTPVTGFDSITGRVCARTGFQMCKLPCHEGFELKTENEIDVCRDIDECGLDLARCEHGVCIIGLRGEEAVSKNDFDRFSKEKIFFLNFFYS